MGQINPAHPELPQQIRTDLFGINAAVLEAGGSQNQGPTAGNLQARKGQTVNLKNEDLFIDDFEAAPERPAEALLPKLTPVDLLPPPSTDVVSGDYRLDVDQPEFVQNQQIEFLVLMKPTPTCPHWTFPTKGNTAATL